MSRPGEPEIRNGSQERDHPGGAPNFKCRDCKKFRPDSINPEAGLGDCDEPKDQVLVRSFEHGEYKWFYQDKLTYPGSEACNGFKRRT